MNSVASSYGLLICYLNVPAYVASASRAVIGLAWSIKLAFALLTDGVPIFGYRRRPYMLLGWGCCSLCLTLRPRTTSLAPRASLLSRPRSQR